MLCWAVAFLWPAIEEMGKRAALKALTLTIASTPKNDLPSRAAVAVTTTTATIISRLPARTLWHPRVTATATITMAPPLFSPSGTADATPALSPFFLCLFLAVLFFLGPLVYASLRSVLRSYATAPTPFERPEKSLADPDVKILNVAWIDKFEHPLADSAFDWIYNSRELLGQVSALEERVKTLQAELEEQAGIHVDWLISQKDILEDKNAKLRELTDSKGRLQARLPRQERFGFVRASGSEETKKAATQDPTPVQEEVEAPVAPVPTTEGPEAPSQLPEPEAVPGTTTSDDGASEAPVTTETALVEAVGDGETEEPTVGVERGEGPVETDAEKVEETDDAPLSSDDDLFGGEDKSDDKSDGDDDDDDDDSHDHGASGAVIAQSPEIVVEDVPADNGSREEPSAPEIEPGEPVNNGEHGQTAGQVEQQQEQEPARPTTPVQVVEDEEEEDLYSVSPRSRLDLRRNYGPALAWPRPAMEEVPSTADDVQQPVAEQTVASEPAPVEQPVCSIAANNAQLQAEGRAQLELQRAQLEAQRAQQLEAEQAQLEAQNAQLELQRAQQFAAEQAQLEAQRAQQSQADEMDIDTEPAHEEPPHEEPDEMGRMLAEALQALNDDDDDDEMKDVQDLQAPEHVPADDSVETNDAKMDDVDRELLDMLRNADDEEMEDDEPSQTNQQVPAEQRMPYAPPTSINATISAEVEMEEAPNAAPATRQAAFNFNDAPKVKSNAQPLRLFSQNLARRSFDWGTLPFDPRPGQNGAPNPAPPAALPASNLDNTSVPAVTQSSVATPQATAPSATRSAFSLSSTSFPGFDPSPPSAPQRPSATAATSKYGFSDGFLRSVGQNPAAPSGDYPAHLFVRSMDPKPATPVAPTAPIVDQNPVVPPEPVKFEGIGQNSAAPVDPPKFKSFPGFGQNWAGCSNVGAGLPFNGFGASTSERQFDESGNPRKVEQSPAPPSEPARETAPPSAPPSKPEEEPTPPIAPPPAPRPIVPSRQMKSRNPNAFFPMERAERDRSIARAVFEATRLFSQWDENSDFDDIRGLWIDGNSELHNHWENIRWASEWFIFARDRSSHQPEDSEPKALQSLLGYVDRLVKRLTTLTQGRKAKAFITYLGTPLRQALSIQEILREAVGRQTNARR